MNGCKSQEGLQGKRQINRFHLLRCDEIGAAWYGEHNGGNTRAEEPHVSSAEPPRPGLASFLLIKSPRTGFDLFNGVNHPTAPLVSLRSSHMPPASITASRSVWNGPTGSPSGRQPGKHGHQYRPGSTVSPSRLTPTRSVWNVSREPYPV